MKISNFKFKGTSTEGEHPFEKIILLATIDIETGVLWWKKKETVDVQKESINWFFVDTGSWTPSSIVENMYKSYKAKERIKHVEKL